MPDKKLTDNEIIKSLETLLELALLEGSLQRAKTISLALSLVNRQKAEIERLQKHNTKMARKHYNDGIKEFLDTLTQEINHAIESNDKAIAERVKKHGVNRYEDDICAMYDGKIIAMSGLKSYIDLLVKETVGDT